MQIDMPRQINVGTENHPIWEELGNPNSVVNMPMERFRFHTGLCSRMARNNTLIITVGLKQNEGDNWGIVSRENGNREHTPVRLLFLIPSIHTHWRIEDSRFKAYEPEIQYSPGSFFHLYLPRTSQPKTTKMRYLLSVHKSPSHFHIKLLWSMHDRTLTQTY